MSRLFILFILFTSPFSAINALEANYRVTVNSILSTDNPDPETLTVVALATFEDAEELISRAANGELISFSFGAGRNRPSSLQAGTSLSISQNSLEESNIIFAPGQTEVIIGRIATGRIVVRYDAAESTFSFRYALRVSQEGSTGTDFMDTISVSFLADVGLPAETETGIDGVNENFFSASSTVTVDFNDSLPVRPSPETESEG